MERHAVGPPFHTHADNIEGASRGKGCRSQEAALRLIPPLPLLRPLSSSSPPPPPPLPPPAASRPTQDPVADFFRNDEALLPPPPRVDQGQLELEATIADALAAPMEFEEEPVNALQLGERWPPQLSMQPGAIQACRAALTPATTETRLGPITQQVQQLWIGPDGSAAAQLFRDTSAPLLSDASAPRRPSAPPKSRATSAPSRRSARKAANPSTTPVTQRASLHLVQGLGILGPKERMMVAAAEALLRRFAASMSH